MNIEKIQTNTLSALRFPLIIGVVFIHSRFTDIITQEGIISITGESFPLYSLLSNLISNVFSRISVPLFFAISGYFFFYRVNIFNAHVYANKLKRRLKSLLIPYIIWNFIVILILLAAELCIPGMMSGLKKSITEWNITDWFYNLYTVPISYQFWFIRDLILLCIFSPIIYYGIKYGKLPFILALSILWIFDLWPNIPGFSIVGIFSFSVGAYFSINQKNFITILSKNTTILGSLYVILSIFEVTIVQQQSWLTYYHNINMIIGMSFLTALFAKLQIKGYKVENPILTKSSFFIFAYHVMPLVLILKICFKIIPSYNELSLICIYLFSTIFIIMVGIGLGTVLEKYFPTFYKVISGGR